MEIFSQVIRLLYRIRFWLIFGPLLTSIVAIYSTKNLGRTYEVSSTLYTGIASGFTIESNLSSSRIDWGSVNNGMDNLISIIRSKATLREVSLRLYVQHMIYGDSLKDNNYIKASNFRQVYSITPKEVRAIIDKTSEEQTIKNLNEYEKASPTNFVYGLFNWNHHYYSYNALSKIEVKRLFESDMLDLNYSANDPGVAYNTLLILNEEFVKQYELLRFGETNNVIEYFRRTLAELANRLRVSEDSLTQYYINKKIINYDEQTKQVTALSRDFDLMYYTVLLDYTSSVALVDQLNEKIEYQKQLVENSSLFLQKISDISTLSDKIARIKFFTNDSTAINSEILKSYKARLAIAEKSLKVLTDTIEVNRYTTEGFATKEYLDEWLDAIIKKTKSFAELGVMEEVRKSLDSQYSYFSPIGSTLKRMERNIGFTEQSYLSVLQSLNAALMRQKTLQMTSAVLRPINPPLFPVAPTPSPRKTIVMATFVSTFILIIGFFILLEIFDRTVRDKNRAERLISSFVLGVFPKKNLIRYRGYNKECERIAINYLANSIVPYLNPKEKPDIINFISTEESTGKSKLILMLEQYWSERGLRVRVISWHEELSEMTGKFILSNNLSELYDYENEDIILVEHQSLRKSAIPVGLLREASINLTVIRADKVWRDIDKISFERLKENVGNAPLVLYLTNTKREVSEAFLGMLPPYSKLRTMVYKFMQFGLTSK